jgi:hypothetical protein
MSFSKQQGQMGVRVPSSFKMLTSLVVGTNSMLTSLYPNTPLT